MSTPVPATGDLVPVHPQAVAAARHVAPHLYDAAHAPRSYPWDQAAWADTLTTVNTALTWADPAGSARSCDHPSADTLLDLAADMLEEKGQYLAAGLVREMTHGGRDEEGRIIQEPPTGVLPAVTPTPAVIPLRPRKPPF